MFSLHFSDSSFVAVTVMSIVLGIADDTTA
jgi:hypothetical protein